MGKHIYYSEKDSKCKMSTAKKIKVIAHPALLFGGISICLIYFILCLLVAIGLKYEVIRTATEADRIGGQIAFASMGFGMIGAGML